jgi:hypothetical protein
MRGDDAMYILFGARHVALLGLMNVAEPTSVDCR